MQALEALCEFKNLFLTNISKTFLEFVLIPFPIQHRLFLQQPQVNYSVPHRRHPVLA